MSTPSKDRALMPAGNYTRAVALLAKHNQTLTPLLGVVFEIDLERAKLIPAADLPLIIAALQVQLQPADPEQVAETIGAIAGAWPHAHQKVDPGTLDLHVAMMAEDLGEFPPDILRDTVRELRRTLKFTPSLAELYQTAERLAEPRRCRLHVAQLHLREHARRDAVARAEAAERAAEHRRHQELLDRLSATHPGAFNAWTVDDVAAMESGWSFISLRVGVTSTDVIDLAEPRGCRAMLAAVSVGGRACLAYRDRGWARAARDQAITLARSDFGGGAASRPRCHAAARTAIRPR